MKAEGLLHSLKSLGIELQAEGKRLRWRAPKGILVSELRDRIKNHKAELLALLRDKQVDSVSEDADKQLPLNTIILGDCLENLKTIPDNSIDLIATDPPFGIGFMGNAWDTFDSEYIKNNVAKVEQSYSVEKAKKSLCYGRWRKISFNDFPGSSCWHLQSHSKWK